MAGANPWAVGLSALFSLTGTSMAAPTIVGDKSDERCRAALNMAEAAWQSSSFDLTWPIPEPPSGPMKIVLRQNDADISGGNDANIGGGLAIDVDPATFEAREQQLHDNHSVTVFWGKQVSSGKRVVMVASPMGWQGDWYTVLVLDADLTPERLGELLGERMDPPSTALVPLIGDNRWNPPIILQDTRTDDYWLIDRGEPYETLADWRVFVVGKDGPAAPCHIAMGYTEAKGLNALPPVVRRLAAALDEALGPGSNEGTLQPTARTRLAVRQAWANAAMRPWAFTGEPYNTRLEVEQGLRSWAKANSKRTALMRRIQLDYPAAENALRNYYGEQGRAAPAALAHHVLDQMFRTYFTFSKSSSVVP